MRSFLQSRVVAYKDWWRRPTTMKDRFVSALIGGIGAIWIGVLGRLILGQTPVSLTTLGWWAIYSVIAGVILGFCFPKVTGTIMYPFSMLGVGRN